MGLKLGWNLSEGHVVCLQDTYRSPSSFPSHQEEALFFLFRLVLYQGTFFFSD